MPINIYLMQEELLDGSLSAQSLQDLLAAKQIVARPVIWGAKKACEPTAILKQRVLDTIAACDWLGFASTATVECFWQLTKGEKVKLPLVAAQDLATAALLAKYGIKADFIPVRPIALTEREVLPWFDKNLQILDGYDWPGMEKTSGIVLTETIMKTIPPDLTGVFVFTRAYDASNFFAVADEAYWRDPKVYFICKNYEIAEYFWEKDCQNVIIPLEFTNGAIIEIISDFLTKD